MELAELVVLDGVEKGGIGNFGVGSGGVRRVILG